MVQYGVFIPRFGIDEISTRSKVELRCVLAKLISQDNHYQVSGNILPSKTEMLADYEKAAEYITAISLYLRQLEKPSQAS